MRCFFGLITALLLFATAVYAQPKPADDFAVKAFYVDCRTEVMTIEAMKALVDRIAAQGMNAIVMEWEATFPFDKHRTLCNEYAFTREQVADLVAYSTHKGVEVIPLQNCFGHSEYILRHERYASIREDKKDPSQVCPLKIKEAVPVFTEIFAEVAALHPSKYFHIGADETYLLGDCTACSEVAAREGKSRLFVDYVIAMCDIVRRMGKTPVIWADIILKYPESVAELPKDLIFVDWNYGWAPDRFGDLSKLAAAGVKMWGAPSLRSGPDNQYLTQWKKHFDNLSVFVPFARRSGYTGMIQTSWSTSGTYGYHYDMGHEIVGMQPVRLVYPMLAFNVLIDATCAALNSTEPIDSREFVIGYAQKQYGLSSAEGAVLWDYFSMPQEAILITANSAKDTSGKELDAVLAQAEAMRVALSALRPERNKEEFAHYGLMLDIRINYLRFKQVEAAYESSSFDRSQIDALAKTMEGIVTECARIDKRFEGLMKGYLKQGEIAYMTRMRNEKMLALAKWINTNK